MKNQTNKQGEVLWLGWGVSYCKVAWERPSQRVLLWEGPDRGSSGVQPAALGWGPGTAEARE